VSVLIDPPAWPAHGTVFSHLVSDTSLIELREFARAAGVPDRAFDLDHYDVPAARHDTLVAAGAIPVDGGELARRLAASGLRIPGGERAGSKRQALLARWDALSPTAAARAGASGWRAVGEALDERWREPHRTYHTAFHLAFALDALDVLLADAAAAGDPVPEDAAWRARVALWFHDAVHDGATPADEEASAALVHDLLGPLALESGVVEEVARLVMVTAAHDPAPADLAGCLVSDADLAILGAEPGVYARYVHQVRAEYAHVPEDLFRQGRAQVLEALLGTGDLFCTAWGRARRQTRAESNLAAELRELHGRG
jgi:predicted metal-dependent HD superfamily phosphohydrolase